MDICDELEQLEDAVGGQTGYHPVETKDGQPIKILGCCTSNMGKFFPSKSQGGQNVHRPPPLAALAHTHATHLSFC